MRHVGRGRVMCQFRPCMMFADESCVGTDESCVITDESIHDLSAMTDKLGLNIAYRD